MHLPDDDDDDDLIVAHVCTCVYDIIIIIELNKLENRALPLALGTTSTNLINQSMVRLQWLGGVGVTNSEDTMISRKAGTCIAMCMSLCVHVRARAQVRMFQTYPKSRIRRRPQVPLPRSAE